MTHDPLCPQGESGCPDDEPNGEWCMYCEMRCVCPQLREVEQRGREECHREAHQIIWETAFDMGHAWGQRERLAKCIEALIAQAATGTARCDGDECHEWADAIRTLRDLQEKP